MSKKKYNFKWHKKCFIILYNDDAMIETSLHFPSIGIICSFLRETNRRNFVLLGKKSILIAPFSADEIKVATKKFGAEQTNTPEENITGTKKIKLFFQEN